MEVNCDERFYRAEFSPLTFFSEWNEYSLQLQNRNDFQNKNLWDSRVVRHTVSQGCELLHNTDVLEDCDYIFHLHRASSYTSVCNRVGIQ